MGERPWWKRLAIVTHGKRSSPKRLAGLALTATFTAILISLLSLTGPWQLIDARIFDYLSTTYHVERPDDGPIIVAIDEPSLAEINRQWPWPRELHAQLIKSLRAAGAKSIGMDIIFAEPSTPQADEALADSMGPDVVLASDISILETAQASQMLRTEPLPQLTDKGARSGVASISLDRDGTLRRIPSYQDGFSQVLLGHPAPLPQPAYIQAYGPPRSYETVSYYQALAPEQFLPPGIFRDKTVIVGLSMQSAPTTKSGGADAYPTPWSARTGTLVSGAEIQATIFDNLATGQFIRGAPIWAAIASVFAAAAAAAAVTMRGTSWRTFPAALIGVVAIVLGSFLLLRFGRVNLPPAAPAFAFAIVSLAQSARDFASERRMRRDITRAFSQYLSPELVRQLTDDPDRLKLGGERRTLTILFCDVRGFTSISERMKDHPEQLTNLVNRLLNPLSDAVMNAGGTIDKYIGDCIMAFWNAPLDDPDHALHAVQAAKNMLTALDRLNAELAEEAAASGEEPIALKIGIGVNTGDCVVGNMGSEKRFDYSALGDAVNLASRLESQTKSYNVSILMGPETARQIGERLPILELDRVSVKGKSETATISTVLINEVGNAALSAHRAFIDDMYERRTEKAIARLATLEDQIPELQAYYLRQHRYLMNVLPQ
ncbi:MAG: adenylate/guanylate cyclase domain-containing protein [Rhizobiaceae bacterium]|nr:adenylate/guanylate cyclase domain-containing protein [Rhizobiaceae bacterium]